MTQAVKTTFQQQAVLNTARGSAMAAWSPWIALHVATKLAAGVAGAATSISTNDPIKNGSTITLGLGTGASETVTATADSTGAGPYATAITACANAHSSGDYVGFSPKVDASNVKEPLTADGYARVHVDGATNTFSAPADDGSGNTQFIGNGQEWDFGPDTTADWGWVTHVVTTDASTAGNARYIAPLTTPQLVQIGGTFKFASAADVKIKEQ